METILKSSPDSVKRTAGKPSARSIWVKIKPIEKPLNEELVVARSPSESVGAADSTKDSILEHNAESHPSIRSVWVVSAKASQSSLEDLKPNEDSDVGESVARSPPLMDSGIKSQESPDPNKIQKHILEPQDEKSSMEPNRMIEFDKNPSLPRPFVKSLNKKSVVTSSPLAKSIWVVSAKRSQSFVNNLEPIEGSRKENYAASSFPFTEGVLLDSARNSTESPDLDGNQQLIVESRDEKSSFESLWMEFDKKLPSHQPAVKPKNKKSVVASSPSVKSVWVESVRKQAESPESLLAKCTKEIEGKQSSEEIEGKQSPVSSPPFISPVLVESEGQSSRLHGKRLTLKKDMLPVYHIPEHLKHQIEMDKVPNVLRVPISFLNYADYFAALLYAEDFYIEKWNGFLLYKVHLNLDEKRMEEERKRNNVSGSAQKDHKVYVLFEISSVPERRPYLLSRDFVFVRRSGKKSAHIEGRLVRVMKSTHVLTEFGKDFQAQHSPSNKYDVSFSFNRTCLKRSHQAVEAALLPSFQPHLFPIFPPETTSESPNQAFDHSQLSAIQKMMTLKGSLPHLVKGPLSVTKEKKLSRVGAIILEAILQIYRTYPSCRVLVTAPKNRTCDVLIANLNKEIPDSELFRANAAFREVDDVDIDVLPLSSYDGECFSEPSVSDLEEFKVIASTFMTSFRLYSRGIAAGHFTHIFMVDASSATEPETMVAMANLVGAETVVVITGSVRDRPNRVRSDIARRYGLKRSYFHRLLESEPYSSNDPEFVSSISGKEKRN